MENRAREDAKFSLLFPLLLSNLNVGEKCGNLRLLAVSSIPQFDNLI